MALNNSQTGIELVSKNNPNLRTSQVYIDVLYSRQPVANLRTTQVYIELLYTPGGPNPPTPPTITCPPIGTGTTGVSFSSATGITGGTAPFTWSIVSGALPPGLTLNSMTGVISGVPTSAGTFSFTIQVKDSNGLTAQIICQIVISTQSGTGSGGGGLPCT